MQEKKSRWKTQHCEEENKNSSSKKQKNSDAAQKQNNTKNISASYEIFIKIDKL